MGFLPGFAPTGQGFWVLAGQGNSLEYNFRIAMKENLSVLLVYNENLVS